MKLLAISLFINIFCISITNGAPLHFPENRYYVPRIDIGFDQYNTPSILNQNEFVLTFDDGPHNSFTRKILDILEEHNVKATFFILSHKINQKNESLLVEIIKKGHIIASHDHEHNRNDYVHEDQFKSNLKRSILLIDELYSKADVISPGYWYRFPYAQYGGNKHYHHMNTMLELSHELFNDNCINFVFWDIDSGDWIPGLSAKDVYQNVKSMNEGGEYIGYKVINGKIIPKIEFNHHPRNGGVILQHDIQQRSVMATAYILDYFKKINANVIRMDKVDEFSFKKKNCKLKRLN